MSKDANTTGKGLQAIERLTQVVRGLVSRGPVPLCDVLGSIEFHMDDGSERLELDKEALQSAARQAEETLSSIGLAMAIHVEMEDDVQMEIVDRETRRPVREISPAHVARMASSVREIADTMLKRAS